MLTEKTFDFSKRQKPNKLNNFFLNCLIYGLLSSVGMGIFMYFEKYNNYLDNKITSSVKDLSQLDNNTLERLNYIATYDQKLKKYNDLLKINKKDNTLRNELIGDFSYFFTGDNLKILSATFIIKSLPILSATNEIYEKDKELFDILFAMYKSNIPTSGIANLSLKCKIGEICLDNTQSYLGVMITDSKILEEKRLLEKALDEYHITVYNTEHMKDYRAWHKERETFLKNMNPMGISPSPGEKYYIENKHLS